MTLADGGWVGSSLVEKVKFIGFGSGEACGARGRMLQEHGSSGKAIGGNQESLNYTPISHMRDLEFRDVDESAIFGLKSPLEEWATIFFCGNFPCTGLHNVIIDFTNIRYSGSPMAFGLPKTFQLTGNNLKSVHSSTIPTCELKEEWNAYMCQTDNLGLLMFESQDGDRMDRSA